MALSSLRMVKEGVWAIRLFNNTADGAECVCRAFGQDLSLSFGKYEVKTLYYDGRVLTEGDDMVCL